jgi:Protein of unknown function (DUF1553)/Protein of unknown function (DUF1549)/Concanavalin A-like lectin/glucanases superfamily/Planctomycete cytochrome C
MRFAWRSLGLSWLILVATLVHAQSHDSGLAEVENVIARNCLECHAGIQPSGELDLTQPDVGVRGKDLQGNPTESEFWQRIEAGEMPPNEELSAEDRTILESWIKNGAKWNGNRIDPLATSTGKRAGRDWWSLQPIKIPAEPVVKAQTLVRNPIDAFLLAELERKGLSFSPTADPRTLIRRVHFDLVGLPPAPEVIRQFEQNPSDEAYAAIVNRLLESPEYGERWARHWLDLVRYGESDGFERNAPRELIWHYRDWVIDAFNKDMPFDEFARQQVAGDLADKESLTGYSATGFLVAGVHNTVIGSSKVMQLLARQDELEDLVGNVGQTFLGLTFNCARCHDHKFDPITQQEYYQLVATFAGVNHGVKQVRDVKQDQQIKQLTSQRDALQNSLRELEDRARESVIATRRPDRAEKPNPLVQPILRWTFAKSLQDEVRALKVALQGDARVDADGLVVDGDGDFAVSDSLPFPLKEKTLEVWLRMPDLNQGGGAAISVETNDGNRFDAIVFAEREPKMWMAGSNGFVRTQPFGGTAEDSSAEHPLHVAITYLTDGQIIAYRNGQPYGQSYRTAAATEFAKDSSRILFGLRHSPPGGNKFLKAKILRAQVYDRALTANEVAVSATSAEDFVSEQEMITALGTEKGQKRSQLQAQLSSITELLKQAEQKANVPIYTQVASNPQPTYFLPRGDVLKPGAEMLPGTTQAMTKGRNDLGLSATATDGERRQKFAEWVTDPNNPLFRRVAVNRVWQYHFGRGLIGNSSDFGFNGGLPSHPELLDWLATELGRNQFHLKPLHRLMVTSSAYRQSSSSNEQALAVDSDNRLLWRKSPTRLDAEVIRDSMLAVAGKLNSKRGGPSFKDVSIVDTGNGTTYYVEFDREDPELNRRTIYRFSPRGGRSALLDTLDCPDPSSAAPRRSVTTTPLQALSLLNSPFVLRMADAFGERVKAEAPDNLNAQVTWMFEMTLGRSPANEELPGARALVENHGAAALARALFNSSEFVTSR